MESKQKWSPAIAQQGRVEQLIVVKSLSAFEAQGFFVVANKDDQVRIRPLHGSIFWELVRKSTQNLEKSIFWSGDL